MKKPVKLEMTFAKSTPGTHVYKAKATGQPPAITSLYIAQWAFDGDPPEAITVSVG
jgi:hypothetical protein